MITIEQIKAARSLLNWNQQRLADAISISKTALANIERGAASPRVENLASIQKALEDGGVEFIDGPGVRLKGDVLHVQVLKGENSIVRLWKDIYATLKEGEERLISGVDESKYLHLLGKKVDDMLEKITQKGIKSKILGFEDDTNFIDPTAKYRWMDKSREKDITYYVYANKYAMLLWEPTPRVVLIENHAVADNYRDQFYRIWNESTIPPGQE